jgi:Putative Ig domain
MRYWVILLALAGLIMSGCKQKEDGSDEASADPSAPSIVTSTFLPAGTLGNAYSQSVMATGGAGSYNWTISGGGLPPGLSLFSDTPAAAISGTPTASGSFGFTLTVTDSKGQSDFRTFGIDIVPGALVITTTALQGGLVGLPLNRSIAASGGSGTFIWGVIAGNLPAGLALVSGTPTAQITGTPTVAGNFNFTLQVTDSAGGADSQVLSLAIAAPPLLEVVTSALPKATLAQGYAEVITAQGGSQSGYSWSLILGTLPTGLSLGASGTPATILFGTPTLAGDFDFTVQVEDSQGQIAAHAFSVRVAAPLAIVTNALPDATRTLAYASGIAAQGGIGFYSWSLVSGALPPGLSISPTGTPLSAILGTPTTSGVFGFTVRVTSGGVMVDQPLSLTVHDPLQVLTSLLADGLTDTAYSNPVLASGGTGVGYTWTVVLGTLPPGLTLASAGTPASTVSGSPTKAGVYQFSVLVTDSATAQGTGQITVNILPVIRTFAGNGSPTTGGNGGQAVMAQTSAPQGVAFKNTGEMLIAEAGGAVIRQVDLAGVITTIAGTGTAGFAGDNGPATLAQFDNPRAILCDSLNNIFIADTINNRIRRIDAGTGVITTVAGSGATGYSMGSFSGDNGPAVNATLDAPSGLAFDAANNLYIADTFNHRIRRVDAVSGVITTVAGSGTPGYVFGAYSGDGGPATSAEFKFPYDVCFDSLGRMLIADYGNNMVRRVDLAGIVTRIAGQFMLGFSGDGGLAINAQMSGPSAIALDASDNIFISDLSNNRVRFVRATTGVITTLAGGAGVLGDGGPASSSSLLYPASLALDASQNLYIADSGQHRVRVVIGP